MTTPHKLKLFGAFRSGSNYARALLELNYDVRVLSGNGGFKHAPVPAVFDDESFRPFPWPILASVKDPYAWLASMWRYVNDVGSRHTIHGATWETFLTEPLIVFQGNLEAFPRYRFANPADYWNAINYNLLSLPEARRSVVRYEDMLEDPERECATRCESVRAGAHVGVLRAGDPTGPEHGRSRSTAGSLCLREGRAVRSRAVPRARARRALLRRATFVGGRPAGRRAV